MQHLTKYNEKNILKSIINNNKMKIFFWGLPNCLKSFYHIYIYINIPLKHFYCTVFWIQSFIENDLQKIQTNEHIRTN